MDKTDLTQSDLFAFSSPAPFGFGMHPELAKSTKKSREDLDRHLSKKNFDEAYQIMMGREISLAELADPRHPEVFIIPRDRSLSVVDEFRDHIGFERTNFPFSSTDFYAELDEHEGTLFYELSHSPAWFRLNGISQLGYLVPPRPEDWNKDIEISYLAPTFPHTRGLHSLLTAILMELILARNGFSFSERAPAVLTAGYHDVATPAGGDSIKRVDPRGLDEEENFSWVLRYYGLPERWAKFGFDLALAQEWVKNRGMFGRLLDVIDKLCYAAIDCYHVGWERPGLIRDFCLKHPLVMDVWQDIRFTPDKTCFGFIDPERLFNFLMLRAYEFHELLYNPYSRAMDLFLKKLTVPLYKKGIITKEQLLTCDNFWLETTLSRYYPDKIKAVIDPEKLAWKRFADRREWKEFQNVCLKDGNLDHADQLRRFNTGLDWPIFSGKGNPGLIPLRETLKKEQIGLLEEIACAREGYYVYYRPEK
ncbi:MAG: HD domain-containing protein [bacterium]|nr:HD domain-containing protein [bacterium]